MNLEELRDVRRTERRQDSLQHLRESFYRDVAAYIADLKREREETARAADDPFSDPEVRRLTDEIESAEEVVESLYERRIGKVVKRATFAAAGMSHDDAGLTDEERRLFDDLVARIETNRTRVLDALDPDAEDGPTAPDEGAGAEDSPPDPAPETASPAPDPNDLLSEAMGGESDDSPADRADPDPADAETADTTAGRTDGGAHADGSTATSDSERPGHGESDDSPASGPETPAPERAGAPERAAGSDDVAGEQSGSAETSGEADDARPDTERRTVHVTEDVGEILGVDERTYRLAAEDVVDLPADNATALVERDAAKPLD